MFDEWPFIQVLMKMDRRDEQSGRMEEIYQQLRSAYTHSTETCKDSRGSESSDRREEANDIPDPEHVKPGLIHPTLGRVPVSGVRDVIAWLSLLFTFQGKNLAN